MIPGRRDCGWPEFHQRVAVGASSAEIRLGFRLYFLHARGLRKSDMQALARGLARLLAQQSTSERSAWLANFTKVRLFAGNPTRTAVAPLLTCIESDALGFALIDDETRHPRIADLLVPLSTRDGPAADTATDVIWDDSEGRWELEVDVTGLDWPRYLVHVLQLLADAALGDPDFGGRITLLHWNAAPICTEDVVQLRLDLDTSPPTCRAVLRPCGVVDRG